MLLRILTVFLFVVCISDMHAQQKWVQFFVDGLSSEEDSRAIESYIASHEGIASVRAESVNGNLLIFIKENFSYSEDTMREWIGQAGFHAWCYRGGVQGVNPIRRISRQECQPLEQKK